MSDETVLRRARADECAALTALAVRSKAHWGYDADFLARCEAGELRVTPETLDAGPAFVLERRGEVLGFYALDGGVPVADLALLFVEPGAIGSGVGARLFAHAVREAAARGCTAVTIESDPFALGFYEAMGAVRIGDAPSTVVAGRVLPLLRYEIR